MKCTFCDGTGKCYQRDYYYGANKQTYVTEAYRTKCFNCNGTGEEPQKTEECEGESAASNE